MNINDEEEGIVKPFRRRKDKELPKVDTIAFNSD